MEFYSKPHKTPIYVTEPLIVAKLRIIKGPELEILAQLFSLLIQSLRNYKTSETVIWK